MFASIQTQKLNLTKCSDPKNGMQKIEFKPSKCASNPPDSEKYECRMRERPAYLEGKEKN
jgi:hypothetical protein